MLRVAALSMALALPSMAFACGGSKATTQAKAETTADTQVAANTVADAAACAKRAELVGENCSYSTGMMAQRVIAEGKPWTFAGTLSAATNKLESHVAAPYTVGPDNVAVVANEVLEGIVTDGLTEGRVNLQGKLLEVDGVSYFVLTGYKALNA